LVGYDDNIELNEKVELLGAVTETELKVEEEGNDDEEDEDEEDAFVIERDDDDDDKGIEGSGGSIDKECVGDDILFSILLEVVEGSIAVVVLLTIVGSYDKTKNQ
jgi:hypothetical protein